MKTFHLALLGPPQLYNDGQGETIQRRKALALLIYLAMTRQIARREWLASLLWPDAPLSRGLSNLRTAIWSLKETLGDDWALAEGDTVALDPALALTVDVRQFRALLTTRTEQRESCLLQALNLYQGDFLTGFTLSGSPEYEDWVYIERENLRGQYGAALDEYIEWLIAKGDPPAALPYARRRVQLDPLNELAQQQLLRLLAWTGQMSAALSHYRAYETLLRSELGIVPSPETEALQRAIAARQLPQLSVLPTAESAPEPRKTSAHLPSQTLPFVGREAELEAISAQLMRSDCRLLTLHGPGGVGKTRLAIRFAEQVAGRQAIGFVSLVPILAAEGIAPAILAALGLQKPDTQSSLDFLCRSLEGQNMLLVLDNYEHLLPDTQIIETLITRLPQLQLLVTSRERLNLREEWVVEVDGLDYPLSAQTPYWQRYSAIELFTLSARRANHAFSLDEADAPSIIEICRFVGGLPLGIELAAAWSDVLSPSEIAAELRRGADLLTTDAQNVPPRQRSVRAVLDYAWSRLTTSEREVMMRLALFVGVFRLDEAQSITGASLGILRRLLHQHLVRRLPEGPYYLHELVRQYAASQLTDEAHHQAEVAFYRYYADYLADQMPRLKSSQQRASARDIFSRWDNIAQACQLMVNARVWARLNSALETIWLTYHPFQRLTELESLFARATEAIAAQNDRSPQEDIAYAAWLGVLAGIRRHRDHHSDVSRLNELGLALLEKHPNEAASAWPLLVISASHIFAGAPSQHFQPLILRALGFYRGANDIWGQAFALYIYAYTLHNAGHYHEVVPYCMEALELFQRTGQPWGMVITLDLLGEHASTLGDYPAARQHYERELHYVELMGDNLYYNRLKAEIEELFLLDYDPMRSLRNLEGARDMFLQEGNRLSLAWVLYQMAWNYYVQEDYQEAHDHYHQAWSLFQELGEAQGMAWSQVFMAAIAVEQSAYTQVDAYLNGALLSIEGVAMPWVVCGVDFVRGDFSLARGDWSGAAKCYQRALALAYEIQSALQTARHILGAAAWAGAVGRVEEALRWTQYILFQPVQDVLIQKRGRALLQAYGQADVAALSLPIATLTADMWAALVTEVLEVLEMGAQTG